jgi:hypothetical protein
VVVENLVAVLGVNFLRVKSLVLDFTQSLVAVRQAEPIPRPESELNPVLATVLPYREEVQEQITTMLEQGIIDESNSLWMAPAVFVPRGLRMC